MGTGKPYVGVERFFHRRFFSHLPLSLSRSISSSAGPSLSLECSQLFRLSLYYGLLPFFSSLSLPLPSNQSTNVNFYSPTHNPSYHSYISPSSTNQSHITHSSHTHVYSFFLSLSRSKITTDNSDFINGLCGPMDTEHWTIEHFPRRIPAARVEG